jgi:hypothetical protein
VDAARLPAAEPASHEAMRLLCLIAQDHSGTSHPDRTCLRHERTHGRERRPGSAGNSRVSGSRGVGGAANDAGSGGSDGSLVRAVMAGLGAASVAFAHLQDFPQSVTQGGSHDAPRLTRGSIARFLCWVCKAPDLFRHLQNRGLLECLVDLLRSSKGDERADTAVAVATVISRHDAARAPLRRLGAITPLVEHVEVCPGPIKCRHLQCNATLHVARFRTLPKYPLAFPRAPMMTNGFWHPIEGRLWTLSLMRYLCES